MRVRASDGHHFLVGEQAVPPTDRFLERTVSHEGRKICIEQPVKPCGEPRFEFAQVVPEFNARIILYSPINPGDIGFVEGWSGGITRKGEEGQTNPLPPSTDQPLPSIRQARPFPAPAP